MRKFEVNGMSCAACQARVEKAVSGVKGVDSCAVSLLTNSMGVEGSASDDDIIKAVEAAGYGASVMERALEDKESPKLVRRLVSSIGILLLLMYLSMGHMMLGWPVPSGLHNHVTLAIVEMILAIAVMVINNKFFVSGFRSLFHLAPNMDTLVALGSTASFGYSLVELFIMIRASSRGDSDTVMSYAMNLYFESAAMIPTLITIGKLLEAKAKGRTTNALKSLLALSPKEARVLRDGQEINVPVEDVKVGDIYILKAGDAVPVDGVVLEGTSAIDESALTGESIPVDKQQGDKVSAGTINTNGFLKCTATRVGEDTTLSQIIQMVGDAAATKAPLARIADKVSAIFVPTVMGLALLTFIVWVIIGQTPGFAIARAISVLVISCPCALGLATPVAIMVGNGVGAKNGILYKTAEALEGAGRVNAVILDKTGTITKGEPGVTDVIPADGVSSEELLTIAYSLEKMSEHPLARAVVDYVSDISTIELTNFETMAGAGIKAVVSTSFSGDGWNVEEGKLLEGGSLKYMKDRLHNSDTIDTANKLSLDGKTPLLFMEGERFLGIIAVADQVKEDSAEAINELKQMGIYTVMLTGDNEVTANAIAKKVFVDKVIAGVMPSQKEQVVASLQKIMSTNLKADSSGALKSDPKSYRVAMVGDGINDAVALTRADTGFAIGAGTDVAVEAADVVLMKNSIKDAAAAIRLSRKTITNIHQNLFWAFFYNALCIPLAMGVYGIAMKPMYGAAAMACSSVFVCLNALRLNLVRLYDSSKDKPLKKNNYQIDKCQIIDKNEGDNEMKKTIKIEGMMCPHCEATVKKALEALDGVTSAEASHEKGIAEVVLEKEVSDDILTKAVTDKDYTVVGIE